MGILIDTSIIITAEKERRNFANEVQGRDESFFLSVISASELLHGVHRAQTPGQMARRSAFVEAILTGFPILEIDLATARAHAQLWAALAGSGTMIGAHDLWIGATCLANGLSLATSNIRDFKRVPGLVIEDWR